MPPLWDPRGGHKTNFSLFLGVPEKTIFLTVSPKLFFKPFLTITMDPRLTYSWKTGQLKDPPDRPSYEMLSKVKFEYMVL